MAAILVVVLLAGCGSGADEAPGSDDPDPTAAAGATDAATDTTEPDVRDDVASIRRVVTAYGGALQALGRRQEVTAALTAVATDAWIDRLAENYKENLFTHDLWMIGRWHHEVEDVEVDGDRATAEVCTDGTRVHVVPRGSPAPEGSEGQGRTPGTITLVRVADGWVVARATVRRGAC